MSLTLYVVQDASGKFIKKKTGTYDGYWTDDISGARLYTRKGDAVCMIGNFIDLNHPILGPFLMEYKADLVMKIDVSEEIEKKRDKKAKALERAEKRRLTKIFEIAQKELKEHGIVPNKH